MKPLFTMVAALVIDAATVKPAASGALSVTFHATTVPPSPSAVPAGTL